MKLVKYVFAFFLIGLMLSACDSLRIEKRRYMKGFYVSSSKKKFDVQEKKKIQIPVTSLFQKNQDSISKMVSIDLAAGIFALKKSEKQNVVQLVSDKKRDSKIVYPNFPFNQNDFQTNGLFEKKYLKEKSKGNSFSKGNYFLLGMAAFFSIAFFAFIKFKNRTAINLSRWAQTNKIRSRAVMVGAQLLIGFGGHFVGSMLYDLDFAIADSVRNIIVGSFLAAIIFYPIQKIKNFTFNNKGYLKRKFCEFALLFTGSLLAICSGNKMAEQNQINSGVHSVLDSDVNSNSEKTFQMIGSNQDSVETDPALEALKIFLTILAILSLLALEVLIVFLACYLTCTDQVGLAAVALIGGTALLVLLGIFTFKSISSIKTEMDPVSSQ